MFTIDQFCAHKGSFELCLMQTRDCAVSLGGGLNEVALNSVAKSKANNSTMIVFKNGPFSASFSLISSVQYTVDSEQMFNI